MKTGDSGEVASGRCVIMSLVDGGTEKARAATCREREREVRAGGDTRGRGDAVLSANNMNHTATLGRFTTEGEWKRQSEIMKKQIQVPRRREKLFERTKKKKKEIISSRSIIALFSCKAIINVTATCDRV